MFIALNKKILTSILLFLLLISCIFLVIFLNFYSQKLQEGRNSIYLRNQYVLDLLYDNINLKKELINISENYNDIKFQYSNLLEGINSSKNELSKEQKLNNELQANYNNTYEALVTGMKILGIGLLVVVLFILLIIYLFNYWVILPVEKLTNISRKVSNGDLSDRLYIDENKKWKDEFDILYSTYNNMLNSMESNIEKIKSREKFLQNLIDTIPDGIRVIDKNYNVIMVNLAFKNLIKTKSNDINQKCYKSYGYNCEGCLQLKFKCPVKELSNQNENFLRTIHEVKNKPLYVNATRLNIDDNYYIIEAVHDLSDDIKFSHQQKVGSLSFLSTSIAHEMKNNLGSIRMIFEGILDNYYKDVDDNDEQKKFLTMAHKQLVETIKVPERLLKIAQYSENEINDLNLSSAIEDMLLMIDYDAKRRGIEIDKKLDTNIIVKCNESDFKMIILNITQNAIKAMPTGGELNIELNKKNEYANIMIKDTGFGIEKSKLRHIFEPFYSANAVNKSSGLGLAIVKNLIEKNNGKIAVKSEVGKGTIFTISLPC